MDCTDSPALAIMSSCEARILRNPSISEFMRSRSCFDRVNPQLAHAHNYPARNESLRASASLKQHGLIGLLIGSLRGKSGERLLQRVLRADGQGAQPRLKGGQLPCALRDPCATCLIGENS